MNHRGPVILAHGGGPGVVGGGRGKGRWERDMGGELGWDGYI